MSKRARDIYDRDSPTPSSPPAKRSHLSQHAASSPIRRRASSTFSTPFAYYSVRTPLTVPLDSPTNPFGLKRALAALELPRPTTFGKHLCLRFQLVDSRPNRLTPLTRKERDGVYRVVQVPLNYTFRHLHKLLLYLFATDIPTFHAHAPAPRRTSARSAAAGASRTETTASAKGKGRARDAQWGGHYFEVLKPASVHNATRPGVLKPNGTVRTKLSSVRERRLFRDLLEPEDNVGESSSAVLPKSLEDEDVEHENWSWEAEDDFTLSKVWSRGPSLDRGIIYYHQPDIAIHITANTLPVPSRKGSGNTPFVFLAQGTTGGAVRIAHIVPTPDGGEPACDLRRATPSPPADGPPLTQAHLDRWNRADAFLAFLRREAERERALQRHPSPAPLSPSAPFPRAQTSVSPLRARARDVSEAPTLPSSDPLAPPSEGESKYSDALSLGAYSDSALYPLALSAVTPYPAHPLHRKRMQRAERRMARLTRSGLVDMMSSDEEAGKKGKGKESKEGGGKGKDNGKGKGKDNGKGKEMERPGEEAEADEGREEVKENVRTYGHKPPRGIARSMKPGRGATKVMKVAADIIDWTPAPDEDGSISPHRHVWGSVEV